MKKYTVTEWNEFSPCAYLSNGFFGLRLGKDPFGDSEGMMAGFTTFRPDDGVDGVAVLPLPSASFSYGGETVSYETVSQTYDFSCGELTTEMVLDCGGKNVSLTHTVFASRTSPTLLIAIFSAKGELAGPLTATFSEKIHPANLFTVSAPELVSPIEGQYDCKYLLPSSDRSTAAGVAYRLFGAFSDKTWGGETETTVTLDLTGKPLYHVTSYVPSVMHSEPHNQAQRMLELARWTGIERLRLDNRRAWAKLWESRITVEGAGEAWQDAIDASFFYLMSTVSPFSPASVPPYGYSCVDAYGGHAFWDTESFMFMPPLFLEPDAARAMLDYRFKRLDAAAANARLNGYLGIQFPWQSGATGSEVTPTWANQQGEQHVNLDVALAFDGFARVHGDEIFIKERAWPVLKGVCEWIESRVIKTDRGYEIHHITGIDEEHADVNNDSYSNLMAVKLLRSGCEYAEMLGYRKPAKWVDIADNLYVPVKDGVLQQYEGMPDDDEMPVTAVMSYFPYGYTDREDPENDRKTWQYYIDHGMEAYCRYPMLSGFLGIFPAWLGDRKLSLRFYEVSNLNFFTKPFHAIVEWGLQGDEVGDVKHHVPTCFITGRGSFLSGLMMGLTKICPWKGAVDAPIEEWLGEDIVLPEGWSKITVGRVTIRGKNYRIEAEHGAKRAKLIEL